MLAMTKNGFKMSQGNVVIPAKAGIQQCNVTGSPLSRG